MSHHSIVLTDVRFSYPDGTPALKGVSFEIGHGEAVAIVGPNGAGKSTVLMHITGLLTPDAGEVRVGELPVTATTLPSVRRSVGYVFQDPDDQLFMPTVAEDVAFGPLNLGLPPEEVRARVTAALERVGASSIAERAPYRLSGGEKRAAAIATVLAMCPSVLVLDEPSAGLDPRARRRLIELLRGFTHTRIIATHDLDLVLDVCERVLVLSDGVIRADGPAREIFKDRELLVACGLEEPLSLRGCPVCGASP